MGAVSAPEGVAPDEPVGLLDTSVFIASESGRTLATDRLPTQSAVSVVTVGELRWGVLMAADDDVSDGDEVDLPFAEQEDAVAETASADDPGPVAEVGPAA